MEATGRDFSYYKNELMALIAVQSEEAGAHSAAARSLLSLLDAHGRF